MNVHRLRHIRAEIRDAGVSTWTGLKPGPPAISQYECGSVVQPYLHKPNEREKGGEEGGRQGERERLIWVLASITPISNPCGFPFAGLGLAGWVQASEHRAALLGSTRGRRQPVISIWAMNYL